MNEDELRILCESYSKKELAEIILLAVDIIRDKNKSIEKNENRSNL